MHYDSNDRTSHLADDGVVHRGHRLLCVQLIDTSSAMSGYPIELVNLGLQSFKDEIVDKPLPARRLDLAIVSFGGALRLHGDFVLGRDFSPPKLKSSGPALLGQALQRGLDLIEQRAAWYRQQGIPRLGRPWLSLVSTGVLSDDWEGAAARLQWAVASNELFFYPVGVPGADMNLLGGISPFQKPPVELERVGCLEWFEWLTGPCGRRTYSAGVGAPALNSTGDWSQPSRKH